MADEGAPGLNPAGADAVSGAGAPAQADAEGTGPCYTSDDSLWDWESRVLNVTPEPPELGQAEAEVPAAAPAVSEPAEPAEPPVVVDASPSVFTPEMRKSVLAGETGLIADWLGAGGDPNARDSKGRTLLMIAASFSNADVVRVALAHGADTELKQYQGVTALMFASMAGHDGIVHLLLAGNACADARDSRGLTAHDYASLKGHYFISCLLLQHSVRHGHPTSSSNEDTSRGSRAEDSLSQSTTRPYDGQPPRAAAGAEYSDRGGYAAAGSSAAASLPAPGAELKRTLTGEAGEAGEGVTVASEVAATADADVPRPWLPTKMLEAAQKADIPAIRAYLDAGGDVNAVDDELLGTMLMCAASSGHDDLAAMLLESGASPDVRDGNGCTALATPCFSQQPGMVRLLLQAGAGLNNQDLLGLTALMVSALSGATAIIRLLLTAGAATDLRDLAGRTAYDYAQINGHVAARKLLRAHRLGRATRPRTEAPVPAMTAEQEERANAAMQELLAEEAVKAAAVTAKAERAARKLHKARKSRKDRRDTSAAVAAQAADSGSVAGATCHASVCGSVGQSGHPSGHPLPLDSIPLEPFPLDSSGPSLTHDSLGPIADSSDVTGADDSTHGSISDWTNDSTHPSLPGSLLSGHGLSGHGLSSYGLSSHGLSGHGVSGHGLAPGRHARFQMPVLSGSGRGRGGVHVGHCTQMWTGYDSTSSTHDNSHITWGGDPSEHEPDLSIASLASSVACSALEDRTAAGEEIPSMLLCPLTGELMRDPVSTVDGQVYERQAISAWLETHDTAPLTGEALPMKLLVPSLPLRTMINEIQERRKLRLVNATAAAVRGFNNLHTSASHATSFAATPPPLAAPPSSCW